MSVYQGAGYVTATVAFSGGECTVAPTGTVEIESGSVNVRLQIPAYTPFEVVCVCYRESPSPLTVPDAPKAPPRPSPKAPQTVLQRLQQQMPDLNQTLMTLRVQRHMDSCASTLGIALTQCSSTVALQLLTVHPILNSLDGEVLTQTPCSRQQQQTR